MSLKFANWQKLSDPLLVGHIKSCLEQLLNSSPKPAEIVDDICIDLLEFGTTPPSVTLVEIACLDEEAASVRVSIKYSGDARIVLRTRVQINPFSNATSPTAIDLKAKQKKGSASKNISHRPLVAPITVNVEKVHVEAVAQLSYASDGGFALTFEKPPLKSIDVHSTFDEVPGVKAFLCSEIESQLNAFLARDLSPLLNRHLKGDGCEEAASSDASPSSEWQIPEETVDSSLPLDGAACEPTEKKRSFGDLLSLYCRTLAIESIDAEKQKALNAARPPSESPASGFPEIAVVPKHSSLLTRGLLQYVCECTNTFSNVSALVHEHSLADDARSMNGASVRSVKSKSVARSTFSLWSNSLMRHGKASTFNRPFSFYEATKGASQQTQ